MVASDLFGRSCMALLCSSCFRGALSTVAVGYIHYITIWPWNLMKEDPAKAQVAPQVLDVFLSCGGSTKYNA